MNLFPFLRVIVTWPFALPFFVASWCFPEGETSRRIAEAGWQVMGLGGGQ